MHIFASPSNWFQLKMPPGKLARFYYNQLNHPSFTHCGRVYMRRLSNLDGAKSYLNQCWNIVNWTPGTYFSEISIGILIFSIKKMHLKMSSAKWLPFVSASMCYTQKLIRVYHLADEDFTLIHIPFWTDTHTLMATGEAHFVFRTPI